MVTAILILVSLMAVGYIALVAKFFRMIRTESRSKDSALSHRLGTLTRPSAKIERLERRRHA